jgi:hypothetical protein
LNDAQIRRISNFFGHAERIEQLTEFTNEEVCP